MRLSKKGISPVIAALLLIVITVTISVFLYIWLSGFIQAQTPTTGTTALGERLKFETAKLTYDADNNKATFNATVRNIGDVTIYIKSAYLLEADGQTLIAVTEWTNGYGPIEVGATANVTATFSNVTLTPNKVYIVKLVTVLGTEFCVRVKAVTS